MTKKFQSQPGKRRRKKHEQIDIAAILKKPIKIGKGSGAEHVAIRNTSPRSSEASTKGEELHGHHEYRGRRTRA